jgi:hypothetical protein
MWGVPMTTQELTLTVPEIELTTLRQAMFASIEVTQVDVGYACASSVIGG